MVEIILLVRNNLIYLFIIYLIYFYLKSKLEFKISSIILLKIKIIKEQKMNSIFIDIDIFILLK